MTLSSRASLLRPVDEDEQLEVRDRKFAYIYNPYHS
jgi:hypothetical protein